MAYEIIILQIMLITIGMIALGAILNKIMGLNRENAKEFREKARNLQERMNNAYSIGDPQEMLELKRESTMLMKQMMKKQLIPTCLRCIIFLGIFAIVGIFYADYASGLLPFPLLFFGDGWVAWYFIFSIGFSLLLYGIKRLYRKVTGKVDSRSRISREIMGMLSPTSTDSRGQFQLTRSLKSPSTTTPSQKEPQGSEKLDLWKDRIIDVDVEAVQVKCPSCKTINAPEYEFCDKCGYKLKQ